MALAGIAFIVQWRKRLLRRRELDEED